MIQKQNRKRDSSLYFFGFLPYIFLLMLALVPLGSLFHPGIPATHDGPDHVARIANFYQSLSEGNLVPRWAGNLNWGFGHPVLMFLYPLPSYLSSIFHYLGWTLVDSTKLVFGATYILSVLAMYMWLKKLVGMWPAITGALLYGFAPYRFVDLYVRGALGEHVAFAIAPIVFYGFSALADNYSAKWQKSLVISALSISALILAHNAISLMFLPLITLYVFYLWLYETKKSIRFMTIAISALTLGFCLSAFFWIPAFIEGKYTLRDIVTKGEFVSRFVPLDRFFYSPWNFAGSADFSKELGILHWIGVACSLWFLGSIRELKKHFFILTSLVVFAVSIFLMTSFALPVWQNITLLQKFQFPWRILSVSVFVSSVLGAFAFTRIAHTYQKWGVCVVIIALLFISRPMWQPNGFIEKPQSYYSGIYNSTTDTGESSPVWSIRFMEKRSAGPLEVIQGVAHIEVRERTTTRHTYQVNASKETRLVENTLYFPGWQVSIDGKKPVVQFQDPQYRGLITFIVPEGKHSVIVEFKNTKVRAGANYLSLFALAALGLVILIPLWKK